MAKRNGGPSTKGTSVNIKSKIMKENLTASATAEIISFMNNKQKAALFLSVGGGLAIGLLIVGTIYYRNR